jgi:ABC-2 type transport system permease protein
MLAIAAAESKMLVRNKLVAFSALLMPFLFGFLMINMSENLGGFAFAASSLVISVVATAIYLTATTTLASRRQNLFLKRMRSTAESDLGIIGGLLLPTVVLAGIQLTVILVGMVVLGGASVANPAIVVVAILLAIVMFVGLALATAGVTNSPEHAQVTTLPVFFIAIAVSVWSGIASTFEEPGSVLGLVRALLPGGGVAELIGLGWSGAPAEELLPPLGGAVLWAIIGLVAARRMFRWEPRV